MATITPTIAQYFIPEIWAQKALEVLRRNVVLAKIVAKDTDVAAFTVGDVLHVPYPGTFTANDKTPNSTVTVQTPSGSTEVQLTLNKHKEVTFIVEDIARAQANQDIMARYLDSGVISIAEQIETDIWTEAASFTHVIGAAGTDLDAADVRTARKTLNDQKAPQADRHIVVSTKDEISLLGDTTLQSFFAFSQPEGVRDAFIGRAYGFQFWMSQFAPVTAGTPDSTMNLAMNGSALMLAMRGLPEPPPGTGAISTTLRDDQSGLVLRVTHAYNPSYLGLQVTIDALYGVKILRDDKAVKVTS